MKNQISNDPIVKDLLADLDEAKRLIRFTESEIQHYLLYICRKIAKGRIEVLILDRLLCQTQTSQIWKPQQHHSDFKSPN
jgi:hypothetical protein